MLIGMASKPMLMPWMKPTVITAPFRDVGRPQRHLVQRIGADDEADADQQAGADPADHPAADQGGEHQSGAARRQRDTGGITG